MDNSFSNSLKHLLSLTDLKYGLVAETINYDISYISKWVNGKMIPAEKNIGDISAGIAKCAISCCDQPEVLLSEYHSACVEELETAIANSLTEAFYASRGGKSSYMNCRPQADELPFVQSVVGHRHGNLAAAVDLFSLSHESMLLFADIVEGRFLIRKDAECIYNLILFLDGAENADIVYNTIFLIHMMTGLSGLVFRVYHNPIAIGKILYSDYNQYAAAAFLSPEHRLAAVTETDNPEYSEVLYQNLLGFCKRDDLLFLNTSMDDMMQGNEYIRSLVSANVRWLFGHLTELLLPEDVFLEIAEELHIYDRDTLHRLYLLSQNTIWQSDTRIILYENCLSDFVIDGELDFYNHRVVLNLQKRVAVINYLLDRFDNLNIRMIDTYLSKDFQFISNPCIFLSDTVSYVRLENNLYQNNICLVNNYKVRNLFDLFFNEVWDNRRDVVLSDKQQIRLRLEHYRDQALLLNKVE